MTLINLFYMKCLNFKKIKIKRRGKKREKINFRGQFKKNAIKKEISYLKVF